MNKNTSISHAVEKYNALDANMQYFATVALISMSVLFQAAHQVNHNAEQTEQKHENTTAEEVGQ